jgi:hypothetical protein
MARQEGLASTRASPDLGMTQVEVKLWPESIEFPGIARLYWEQVEAIIQDQSGCYNVDNGEIDAIRVYSEWLGRSYSLYPTEGAPTMLVSGIPMHRIKDTDPGRDTLSKIKAIAPVKGRVLDTTTGLGYTAIQAANTASHVTTIDLDPAALKIARQNPWSQALFDNPKITQLIGDSYEMIAGFPDGSFSCLIHDPPTFSLAGELYSLAFYEQAYRVLKNNGKMFHYIGDPKSKSGARLTGSVTRRLRQAGFRQVIPKPQAFGLAVYK